MAFPSAVGQTGIAKQQRWRFRDRSHHQAVRRGRVTPGLAGLGEPSAELQDWDRGCGRPSHARAGSRRSPEFRRTGRAARRTAEGAMPPSSMWTRNTVPRWATRCSGPSAATLEPSGSGESWRLGSARSAGSPVRAITLGRACAAHRTEFGALVSAALAKSHPPAPGERIRLGLVQDALAGGSFELPAILLEVRIATKIFPGEAGRVERPKFLIRARSPPVGAAHRRRLHWQVADHSACREDTRDGGGSVRPGPATRVAVAARNRVAASVARPRVADADSRSPSSNGLAPECESQARRARSGSRAGSIWRTIRATSRQSAPSASASSRRRYVTRCCSS